MSILPAQIENFRSAVRAGLRSLYKPPPLTAVDWCDQHYYLPVESSYHEGKWETLPFQRAIMNAMGSDYIREVNLVKSARVGYSKMLLGVVAYLIEHKQRNGILWQPTETAATDFMKTHVEPTIRDVPPLLALAPWYGKKHRDNTLTAKRFSNGRGFWCLGGTAARNFREKSVDFGIYDELAAFPPDIEKEGPATQLGDKRMEGSTWPKSIRGSTPKIRGTCQIERAASESPHFMRFHVPCPHCGELQYLKWGGTDCGFGIKWENRKPETAYYQCEHNGCFILQHELDQSGGRWICERTGIWTEDGIDWYGSDDFLIEPPVSVTFHVWTAYSPFTTWVNIVREFYKAKGDYGKFKTFTNTTLGETWEEDQGARPQWEALYGRREVYAAQVPDPVVYITGGADWQDDRVEGYTVGWCVGEESYLIDRWVLFGDPASEELRRKVEQRKRTEYTRADGTIMTVARWCDDSGGHYTDEVYNLSKKLGVHWVIPVKGASVYGKPIADFPRKRNSKGVFLTMVGTDNAKELIYNRLAIQFTPGVPTHGAMHFPMNDEICGETELRQLTAESKVMKVVKGRRTYLWDAGGRRNEALDCYVYALAALRISQQNFGIRLENLQPVIKNKSDTNPIESESAQLPRATQPPKSSGWIGVDSSRRGGWL